MMELELKLLVDPASRGAVEAHPAFAGAKGELRREVTTYFDTPDLELRRHGVSLRVRSSGLGFTQTVKLNDGEAGLGARGEWEWPVPSAEIHAAELASLPKEAAVVRDRAGDVRPLFKTEIERKVWDIELDRDTRVEAVLDEGSVQAGRRSATICEVELELKQGSSAPLFQLAIDLADRAALRYGPQSKAERGYALFAEDLEPTPAPKSLQFAGKATVAEVFPKLVGTSLRALAGQIPFAASRDVEGVHRMRAAIRKIRTILVLFAPYLDGAAADRFNEALRDLGRVLGRSRDWDVFLTETLPKAEAELETTGLALLRPAAEARSAEAHEGVGQAMMAPLLTGLILGLGAWVADAGWLRHTKPDTPVRDLLPHLLDRLERKVRRRAKHLDLEEVEMLHDLRKTLKKLRYSVEDVGSLFQHKGVHRYLRALKGVLSVLGEINDAAVTVERVGQVAPDDHPQFAPAAAALLRWNGHRRAKALRKLDRKLQSLLEQEPFWA